MHRELRADSRGSPWQHRRAILALIRKRGCFPDDPDCRDEPVSAAAPAGHFATATRAPRSSILTGAGYTLVALAIYVGWSNSDLNLVQAQQGLGYWLGIVGATLMALLLLYPARKRIRSFRSLGPVRHWFRIHMIFGVLGPVLVLFHCNFQLGSINSRIALFSTLIVAASGVIGRYIYSKLHYGLYGQRASLMSLREDLHEFRGSSSAVARLLPTINAELVAWEDGHLDKEAGVLGSFLYAVSIGLTSRVKSWQLARRARRMVAEIAQTSSVVAQHERALLRNAETYLARRILLVQKFAQYRSFERLFALWHIVHFPLFLLLVLAVIVHVLAVHMY